MQLAAIPLIIDGKNVILCAATASGKTEAALAPLVGQVSSRAELLADHFTAVRA